MVVLHSNRWHEFWWFKSPSSHSSEGASYLFYSKSKSLPQRETCTVNEKNGLSEEVLHFPFRIKARVLQSAESIHYADWIALALKQQGVYSISAERFLLLFRAKRYFSTTCWQGWCLHCVWEQWSICWSLTLLFLIQGHRSPISIQYEFCWVENFHSDSSESVLYLCREIAASTTLHCIWEQWSLT